MKTIGIKLADGSFYPILKEGTAEKKELNLTTVKDNQTTVQVDLYRSETESMQDAEYVDTLEIKHLVKHPNGEPDIALDISIDENNELNAELHDPETGKDSSTTVSLVSRTIEQRSEMSDVTLAQAEDAADFSDIADDDDFDLEKSISTPVQDDSFSADGDFSFDPNSLNVDSIVEEPAEENQETFDETVETDTTDTEESDTENTAAVAAGAGLLGAAAALALNDEKDESSENSDETISEEISDDIFSDDTIADETSLSENVSDEALSDTADTALSDDDFNIPDDFSIDDTFDEMSDSESADTISDESVTEQTNDETVSAEDDSDFNVDSNFDDLNFDDLNIDDDGTTETQTDEASTENAENIENTETEDSLFNDSFEQEENLSASNNAGLDFSDILDKETKEGHASDSIESEVISKKTKVPVVICVTCAVICIIAVLLILFVIPSKFNLVKKQAEKESSKTVAEQTTAPEQKEAQPKYEAKENEIIVAPAEKVVPEVQQEKPVNSKNITYKIKWGDTLWDLAKSYYNNPWKYPKIAKYNGIKNPDHIISGTTIIIPAE
ncbi:MAG: LysM peptidoglycan-binding domain-containing protein [Treponema sp.]